MVWRLVWEVFWCQFLLLGDPIEDQPPLQGPTHSALQVPVAWDLHPSRNSQPHHAPHPNDKEIDCCVTQSQDLVQVSVFFVLIRCVTRVARFYRRFCLLFARKG